MPAAPPPKPRKLRPAEAADEDRTEDRAEDAVRTDASPDCRRRSQSDAAEDGAAVVGAPDRWEAADDGAAGFWLSTEVWSTPAALGFRALPSGRMKATSSGMEAGWKAEVDVVDRSSRPKSWRADGSGASVGSGL